MIDSLYNLSLQVPDLLILVACAVVFGGLGVLIARLAHRLWWSRMRGEGETARDAGDGVHNSILALIAFLLALITTSELASYRPRPTATSRRRALPSGAWTATSPAWARTGARRAEAACQLCDERGEGRMAAPLAPAAIALAGWPEQYMNQLWAEVRRLQPRAAPINSNLSSDLNDSMRKVEDGRVNRLSASVNGIPDVVWLMIGLFFFSACVLAGRHRLSRYAMQVVFIQMSALGVILALNIIIDNPFGGDTSLGPQRIIASISGNG